ncbi:hypothetical protein LC040_14215 [Bacillus tianshenii]|nr:hypothetical protein LC040_14215 [Bacillus tianshenii]
MGDYLYFPENKLEYIPSVIMLLIIVVAAVLTVILFKKISNRQMVKAKELEKQLGYELEDKQNQPNHSSH